MYRVGTVLKQSSKLKLVCNIKNGTGIIREYSSKNNNNDDDLKKKYSDLLEDLEEDLVIDLRKIQKVKEVVKEEKVDINVQIANLNMKDMKLMRYDDNPEDYEIMKKVHFNINDAFELDETTKDILEKERIKQQQELKGSKFKSIKLPYSQLSENKSQYIADQLNKFKDQFEKPLVDIYNSATSSADLSYRSKKAEEKVLKRLLKKKNSKVKLSNLEKHYIDLIQVRNAVDFRGKSILADFDEEDAWQRILERTEITDPHNLNRNQMTDEYNDLGEDEDVSEEYLNQLAMNPFNFANPNSYSSMINLMSHIEADSLNSKKAEIFAKNIYDKYPLQESNNSQSEKQPNQEEQEIKEKVILQEGETFNLSTTTSTTTTSTDPIKPIIKATVETDYITIPSFNDLKEALKLPDISEVQKLEEIKKIESDLKFLRQFNKPSVANAKTTSELMEIAQFSLSLGSPKLTEDQVIDLMPEKDEIDDQEGQIEQEPFDATTAEQPTDETTVTTEPVEEEIPITELYKVDDAELKEIEKQKELKAENATTNTTSEKETLPTSEQQKEGEDQEYENLNNLDLIESVEDDLVDLDVDEDYTLEQLKEQFEAEDNENEEYRYEESRPPPSELPNLNLLSTKIRKNEELVLERVAKQFANSEINEKTAIEALDILFDSYKKDNILSEDVIQHDKDTIREANGDVAVPDSVYFDYDSTFRDLVDRDINFKMHLSDTDLIRVLTHQLNDMGLLKQEKILKVPTDNVVISKEQVQSNPVDFPDFVKEVLNGGEDVNFQIKYEDNNSTALLEEEPQKQTPSEEQQLKSSTDNNNNISNVDEEMDEKISPELIFSQDDGSKGNKEVLDKIKEQNEKDESSVSNESQEWQKLLSDSFETPKVENGDEIYDERRLYINFQPMQVDRGVITVKRETNKKKTHPNLEKTFLESADNWLMGKPFDMLKWRLHGQTNDNVPLSKSTRGPPEDSGENDVEDVDEAEQDIEDERFQDFVDLENQDPLELFEEAELYRYLQEGGGEEWFRPEKLGDKDIQLLQRGMSWFPREHIHTYPYQFASSHSPTDQTQKDEWANRKAILKVNINAFDLPRVVEERLADLTGKRFDKKSKVLTLVVNDHDTLQENKFKAKNLFRDILHEANLADPNFISTKEEVPYKSLLNPFAHLSIKEPVVEEPQELKPKFIPSEASKLQSNFSIFRLYGFPNSSIQHSKNQSIFDLMKSKLDK